MPSQSVRLNVPSTATHIRDTVLALNLGIANEVAGAEPFEPIRLRRERFIASQTNRFRQNFAHRWRQHETMTAKAYGQKESRILGVRPQNGIFVWRHVIVPSPSPLQLQRGTGR